MAKKKQVSCSGKLHRKLQYLWNLWRSSLQAEYNELLRETVLGFVFRKFLSSLRMLQRREKMIAMHVN